MHYYSFAGSPGGSTDAAAHHMTIAQITCCWLCLLWIQWTCDQ